MSERRDGLQEAQHKQKKEKKNNNYCPTSCSKVGKRSQQKNVILENKRVALVCPRRSFPMSPKTLGSLHNRAECIRKANVGLSHKAGGRRFKSAAVHTAEISLTGQTMHVLTLCNFLTREWSLNSYSVFYRAITATLHTSTSARLQLHLRII